VIVRKLKGLERVVSVSAVDPIRDERGWAFRDAPGGEPDPVNGFEFLLRFDPVYHGHFKCNIRRVIDYPSLWGFTRDLISVPGVGGTVDIDQVKRHYCMTHPSVNPNRIVPAGPVLAYHEPHGREVLLEG